MSSRERKMVDFFEHMNKLQGKSTFAKELNSVVKALRVKIKLICSQLSHHKFNNTIFAPNNEFCCHFVDFHKLGAEYDIVSSPFTN